MGIYQNVSGHLMSSNRRPLNKLGSGLQHCSFLTKYFRVYSPKPDYVLLVSPPKKPNVFLLLMHLGKAEYSKLFSQLYIFVIGRITSYGTLKAS